MAWAPVRVYTITKASQWLNLIAGLTVGHSAEGVHAKTLFRQNEPLTNPHVMDTSPAACVSVVAAGADRWFMLGTTNNAIVHWDYLPIHSHMNVSAGLTLRVFFQPASAPAAKQMAWQIGADRWRNGVAGATITGTCVLVNATAVAGLSVAVPVNVSGVMNGDALAFNVERTAVSGEDTFAGDVYVLSAQLEYTYQ